MSIKVPFYMIAKKTLCGGFRLPKKPKVNYMSTAQQVDSRLPGVYRGIHGVRGSITVQDTEMINVQAEFSNMEYRFWALETLDHNMPPVCTCRNCEQMELKREDRKKHLNKHGCSTTIIKAYKILLESNPKHCIMCGEICYNEKFGVPVCLYQGKCLEKFFVTPQPEALRKALDEVAIKYNAV